MLTYTETVRDHFTNPRNVGDMTDATVIGEVGSMAAGQALKLYLKLDENERVVAASFKVFGSPGAIASSSALTEMIKGKHIDEAARVTADEIRKYLGGLPPEKMHACILSMEALEAAYARYRGIDLDAEDAEFKVCRCYGISEQKIERAIRDHDLTQLAQITQYTRAGAGCNSCHDDVKQILARVRDDMAPPPAPAKAAAAAPRAQTGNLSNLQKMQMIQEVLDREVRPGLAMDGGDMELVDVQGNKVFVELHGHCNSCSASSSTMKFFVQDRLREMVDPAIEVIDTTEHAAELHAPPMR
jgi:NifU-like protein